MNKTQMVAAIRELRDRIELHTGYSTALCMIPSRDLLDTLDMILPQPKVTVPDGDRDGVTYDPERDFERLNKQMQRVWGVVRDGQWWSLNMIASRTGVPAPSVSARLRDLRKEKFGEQEVQRKRVEGGYWVYRVVRPDA